MRDLSSASHRLLSHCRDPVLVRLPLLIAIVVAGLLAAGFYSARPPARTDVPGIDLPTVRERVQPKREPERERPAGVNRGTEEEKDGDGGSGGGGGGSGATPVPAPAPTPAGGGDDDDDDDEADGDDGGDDGNRSDD
jgi:hypothetical protein